MHVEGKFETFVVTVNETRTFYDVPFVQSGFSYTAYLDFELYPMLTEGAYAYGTIQGDIVASGTVRSLAPITREGQEFIRVTVSPKTPHALDRESLQNKTE